MKKNEGHYPLCGGCSRKEKRDDLEEGEYYCAFAEAIFADGVVTNDTDATSCKKWQSCRQLIEQHQSYSYISKRKDIGIKS